MGIFFNSEDKFFYLPVSVPVADRSGEIFIFVVTVLSGCSIVDGNFPKSAGIACRKYRNDIWRRRCGAGYF